MSYVVIYQNADKKGVSVMSIVLDEREQDALEKIELKAKKLLSNKKFFIVEKESLPMDILPDFWLLDEGGNITIDESLIKNSIISDNKRKKLQLLQIADKNIVMLQEIIELEMQESNEDEQLKNWKKYRILLTRVDVNSENVVFPEKP
jgi:hypothetical protein